MAKVLKGVQNRFRREQPDIARALELLENAIDKLEGGRTVVKSVPGWTGGGGGGGEATKPSGNLFVSLPIHPSVSWRSIPKNCAVGMSFADSQSGIKKLVDNDEWLGDSFVGVVSDVDSMTGLALVQITGEILVSYYGTKEGLQKGMAVYASASSGQVTMTRPTASGKFVLRVGFVTDPMRVASLTKAKIAIDTRERIEQFLEALPT